MLVSLVNIAIRSQHEGERMSVNGCQSEHVSMCVISCERDRGGEVVSVLSRSPRARNTEGKTIRWYNSGNGETALTVGTCAHVCVSL